MAVVNGTNTSLFLANLVVTMMAFWGRNCNFNFSMITWSFFLARASNAMVNLAMASWLFHDS